MKLRMRANTLRLRLTRGEVDRLGEGQTVREVTHFPDGTSLIYALAVGGTHVHAAQQFVDTGSEITVTVPSAQAREWAGSQEVGFGGDAPVRVGPLEVLIEKDFSCITPREGEEELDTFPNPNQSSR
jgi:phage baseplate assembly protein gpV